MFHTALQFCYDNYETLLTIAGSIVVGASAACALVPGGGLVKRILSVLALNVRNATPEQIAKGKALLEAGLKVTKKDTK